MIRFAGGFVGGLKRLEVGHIAQRSPTRADTKDKWRFSEQLESI